jgi:lysozyme
MAASVAARMSGIDVSHFQQEIDWQQVRRAGIAFAFIKATEGIGIFDPCFNQNWRKAKSAPVLRGAYHFFHPQLDAEAQARFFLDKIADDPGDLPPVLDVEVLTNIAPEHVIVGAHKWLETAKSRLGRNPILYTGSAFWRNTLKNSLDFSDYPLWIAHHTAGPNPLVPSAWPRWTFWQFSQQGKVAGITGNVDLDVFNGTAAELDAFCMNRTAVGTRRIAV